MFRRIISKKLRITRVSFPAWVLGVALLVVAAAAGQAVGPVLSGGIHDSAGLVIKQSVVLGPSGFSLGGGSDNDGIFDTNDEGTGFTAALEPYVGDGIVVGLDLGNLSDAPAYAMLSLNVPRGIDVEVTSDPLDDDIKEAQLSAREWLVTVASLARAAPNDSLDITISPKDGLKPGFSTITGRIVQVAN